MPTRRAVLTLLALASLSAALVIGWRFGVDMQRARTHAAQARILIPTRCGPIEVQESGAGIPLLAVDGGGGGHDQGMAFAGALARQGIRQAAVMGGSACAPSALQMAIRHPDRQGRWHPQVRR